MADERLTARITFTFPAQAAYGEALASVRRLAATVGGHPRPERRHPQADHFPRPPVTLED